MHYSVMLKSVVYIHYLFGIAVPIETYNYVMQENMSRKLLYTSLFCTMLKSALHVSYIYMHACMVIEKQLLVAGIDS